MLAQVNVIWILNEIYYKRSFKHKRLDDVNVYCSVLDIQRHLMGQFETYEPY